MKPHKQKKKTGPPSRAEENQLPIPGKQRFLLEVRERMAVRHISPVTRDHYLSWIVRYIHFNGKRHPGKLGEREVEAFLADLAVRCELSASSQNQALAALIFLYRDCLGKPLHGIDA